MKKWCELPKEMQVDEVKIYYSILQRHKGSLVLKRGFDIVMSILLLIAFSPVFLVISIMIKLDSPGPVMFRQTRITRYGKQFAIFKFRTMVNNADKIGTQVTTKGDTRVTKIGKRLRDLRIDEIPQLLNVLVGEMSFVGTRPEVVKYVLEYTNEMKATLLLPAGITSRASIEYKDESRLLENAENADNVYINEVLPGKMKYNLQEIKNFNFMRDIITMIKTVGAVIK